MKVKVVINKESNFLHILRVRLVNLQTRFKQLKGEREGKKEKVEGEKKEERENGGREGREGGKEKKIYKIFREQRTGKAFQNLMTP